MALKGFIHTTTGVLLGKGFEAFESNGFFDPTIHTFREDVPDGGLVYNPNNGSDHHVWNGSAWVIESNSKDVGIYKSDIRHVHDRQILNTVDFNEVNEEGTYKYKVTTSNQTNGPDGLFFEFIIDVCVIDNYVFQKVTDGQGKIFERRRVSSTWGDWGVSWQNIQASSISGTREDIIWTNPSNGIKYQYDKVRSKWLSVEVFTLAFSFDGNIDGGYLKFGEMVDSTGGVTLPENSTLVYMSARGDGNTSKTFDIDVDSVFGVANITLSGGVASNMNVNVNVDANKFIQVYATGAGFSVEDPCVILFFKWRK